MKYNHNHLPNTGGSNGPMGAVGPSDCHTHHSPGANGPNGYHAPVMKSEDAPLISITNSHKTIMKITADGNVEWYGKPSQAADALRRTMESLIDDRVKPSTRQRMYINACRSILSKARSLEKEDLIKFLEDSIENRESKAVILSLREIEDDSVDGI